MFGIRFKLSALFMTFFFPIVFLAQENGLEYKKQLTISDGLAHNGVTSILEDSHGLLWFGTYDGLNRYDGYGLKTFKNTVGHELFVSNRIRALAEDKNGNIWIGTDEGISLYDYRKSQFKNVYSNRLINKGKKGPVVRNFTFDSATNTVFVATESDGVLSFDTNYSFLKQHTFSNSTFSSTKFFGAVGIHTDSYLYATSTGLLRFNTKDNKFQEVLNDEIQFCTSVTLIADNMLIVTQRRGIALIEYEYDGSKFNFRVIRKDILPEYRFNFVKTDPSGKLWLGTLNDGAIRFNSVDAFKNAPSKNYSHFKPKTGLLRVSSFESVGTTDFWMGTFDKGVYQFDTSANPFKTFEPDSRFDFGVNNQHIRHITKFDENRFYITKNKGGVVLFNTSTNQSEQMPFQMPEGYRSKISAIFVDSKKNTLIKVVDTGYFFMSATQKIPHQISTSMLPKFAEDTPYKFTEDKRGNIWVSCRNDVYRIKLNDSGNISEIENLNAHELFADNKLSLVRYVYADPLYDYVWLGTADDGLVRLDIGSDSPLIAIKAQQYRSSDLKKGLPSNFVSAIVRTPKGKLWIGTEGAGICEVLNSNKTPEFIPYSEKQGLSNNVVKSILVDDEENLWVATNIGLNKFSTVDKTFRRFNKEDGLPFEDFWYTSTQFENGKLLFTGLEGFYSFLTEDIPAMEKLPKLQFGNFRVSNKIIHPFDSINGRVLLTERLTDSSSINLKHDENVFSVESHSLHFRAPENHRIKYRLTPLDNTWIETTSDQKTISYSGLQPDEYTLQVSASNPVGEWTLPKTLFITIAPPFWKTTQAYLLYALLTLLILGTILYYILKIQNLKHNIQFEKLEKDATKSINEAKLHFFANISHELKTPLNLITIPVKVLSEKFSGNEEVKQKLSIVERQSRKISQLIDQVSDFESVEANTMQIEYSRFYFDSFLEELLVDFHFLAENSSRELKVIFHNSNIVVSADRNKLEKIFNNLLSNAFKYSNAGDKIVVEFDAVEKDLSVIVTDTGHGIDKDDLPHIFERFFRARKNKSTQAEGSGIGLAFSKKLVEMHYGYIEAQSELGKGTKIQVRLPIVKEESAMDQETRKNEILSAETEIADENQWLEVMETTQIEVEKDYAKNTIYYVEDNVDMQIYLSNILSKYFKVKVFGDGAECIRAMEDEWPDIIISDIQMPIMDGLELCKRIKSDMKTSHIPVVLLTALSDIENRILGIRDGADAYIQKPFDMRQVVTRIVALLENKRRLRERFEVGLPMTKDNNVNNRNDDAFLEKLYHLMTENIANENLDMDEFARKLFLNRTHFYQKVKSLTDKTPFELLKMYRLRRAAELLAKDKKLSVSEVYVMTGFKSRTHFSKLFKEKYNVSPGKFVATKLSN